MEIVRDLCHEKTCASAASRKELTLCMARSFHALGEHFFENLGDLEYHVLEFMVVMVCSY